MSVDQSDFHTVGSMAVQAMTGIMARAMFEGLNVQDGRVTRLVLTVELDADGLNVDGVASGSAPGAPNFGFSL